MWIGESIRVVYETSNINIDSLCCTVFNDWIKTPDSNNMLLSDLYFNVGISHKKGDFNKEFLGVDEYYSVVRCDMEWFSIEVSSEK